jgi:hypothetical protein
MRPPSRTTLVLAILAVSLASCTSDRPTVTSPPRPITATVDGTALHAETDRGDPSTTDGTLTLESVRGLASLAETIGRSNPRKRSGGCGMACDGLTFSVTIDSESSQPGSGMWGRGWRCITHERTYERTRKLLEHLANCEGEPWLTVADDCVPLPRNTR